MTPRVFVLHWDAATLGDKVARAQAAGAQVVGHESEDGRRAHDAVRRLAPDLLLVWLQCKPSHGRVTAAAIRSTAGGRKLPILFVTDDPDAVPEATLQRIKAALPDALVDRVDRLAFWVERIGALVAANNP